jgi:hypothetical protein
MISNYLEIWIICSSPKDIIREEVFMASPEKIIIGFKNWEFEIRQHSNLILGLSD